MPRGMFDVALTHYSGDAVQLGKVEISTYRLQVLGFVELAATSSDPLRGLNGISSEVSRERIQAVVWPDCPVVVWLASNAGCRAIAVFACYR
jgi:hypothetical protein